MRRLKENENCFDAITFNIRLLVSNRFTLHFQVHLTVELNRLNKKWNTKKKVT